MSWRTVEGEARGAGQSPEPSEEGGGILTGAGGGAGCSGNTMWGREGHFVQCRASNEIQHLHVHVHVAPLHNVMTTLTASLTLLIHYCMASHTACLHAPTSLQ